MKAFLLAMILGVAAAPAWAQKVPAMPVAPVTSEALPDISAPIVVELFTSKACVFCPQANRLFAELAQQAGIVALSCHVDYYGGQGDPLATPFCRDRQSWYMDRLRAGPAYTPQLVINGVRDTSGARTDRVMELVGRARRNAEAVKQIAISALNGAKDDYAIVLPKEYALPGLSGWQLTVATFRKPVTSDAAYRGEDMVYARSAESMRILKLDTYKGPGFRLTVPMTDENAGFTVFLQRQDTGQIAAAGQFISPGDKAIQ